MSHTWRVVSGPYRGEFEVARGNGSTYERFADPRPVIFASKQRAQEVCDILNARAEGK